MKATHLSAPIAAIFTATGNALAASGAREDNSDFVVWLFLAFCALIVIGQMVPMVKSLRQHKHAMAKEQTVKEKA